MSVSDTLTAIDRYLCYRATPSPYGCATTDNYTIRLWDPYKKDKPERKLDRNGKPIMKHGECFCLSGKPAKHCCERKRK